MKLITEAITFSKRFSLFEKGERGVIGVSGGRDSIALLHILWRYKEKFGLSQIFVAHFNHKMRSESYLDANFIAEFSRSLGVECFIGEAREPLSSEDEARKARYNFLREIAEKVSAQKIITAHTLDDQFETFLMKIGRGGNIFSAVGIYPKNFDICSPKVVVRPLLLTKRKDLMEYIIKENLKFVEDRTNYELDKERNRIRYFLSLIEKERILDGFKVFWISLYELVEFIKENKEEMLKYEKKKNYPYLFSTLILHLKNKNYTKEDVKKIATRIMKGLI